jgi:hypothetical protein
MVIFSVVALHDTNHVPNVIVRMIYRLFGHESNPICDVFDKL